MTTWTRRGWYLGGVQECLFLSTLKVKNVLVEVGGGQNGQNCVHEDIEFSNSLTTAAKYNKSLGYL